MLNKVFKLKINAFYMYVHFVDRQMHLLKNCNNKEMTENPKN